MRSRQESTTNTIADDIFTSYNYNKLSRLSHEELMIPLIYWSCVPKHVITAILVHKSLRFGELMITGSISGEFVIWKSKSNFLTENDAFDMKWIAMAMTISTNTTAIKSILGLSLYGDETSFAAIHNDGELEILSVSGSGVLKICRSDRPIICHQAIQCIFPCNKINQSYKYMLATNFYNDLIHLIDLNKGKEIKQFALPSNQEIFKVIDIVCCNTDINTFICIDVCGKIAMFKMDKYNNCKAIQTISIPNKSSLRNVPICMDITLNDKYVVAISCNEFAVYCLYPILSNIASKTERDAHWNGLLVFDKYINYEMLPDFHHRNDEDEDDDDKKEDFFIVQQPFFVFLWENNCKNVTLYLVSKETSRILTPMTQLIIFDDNEDIIQWNVITNDDEYIYVPLHNGKIISFSIEKLREVTIAAYGKLLKNNFRVINNNYIAKLESNISGDIKYSFDASPQITSHHNCSSTTGTISRSLTIDEEMASDMIENVTENEQDEDENNITCSCMNIASVGVLLCLGYDSGEVYIYNITSSSSLLSIHTRLSSITCLLLQCIPCDGQNDGILFIGYSDGYIEIFNLYHNENIFSKQCHFASVDKLMSFERDYYVFSIGSDNTICSYLIYSQLTTMKCIMDQIGDDLVSVKWCYYRGHPSSSIINLYRNEWCLINDFLIVELTNKEVYIWNVCTSQIERHFFDERQYKKFKIDRSLNIGRQRKALIANKENKLYNVYDINNNSSHLNVNCLILDIVSIFKPAAKDNNRLQIGDIIRTLSLLLDWDIHSTLFNNLFIENFEKYLSSVNYNNCNNNPNKNDDFYNLLLIKDIKPCFGFVGDYQSMTMLFPICSNNGGKWKMQSKFTSSYMLAISALCAWLRKQIESNMKKEIKTDINLNILQFIKNELVHFYSVLLPSDLSGFVEPSQNMISRSCLSSTSALRKTARVLLENMVKRMLPNEKEKIVTKWKNKCMLKLKNGYKNGYVYRKISDKRIPFYVLFNAIILCMIQIDNNNNKMDKTVALSVIEILIGTLRETVHHKCDEIKKSLCCYYLGRIIGSWFNLMAQSDENIFVSLLNILLTLCSDYDDLKNKNGNILSESAMFCLIECGAASTQIFVKVMGLQSLQISKRGRHSKALQAIQRLIYAYPLSILKYVAFTINTIIKCLDPASPQKRKILLKSTTSTLHALIHKFPNCSFHADTQHFACYNHENNCIVIYDLRTATRFGKSISNANVSTIITAIEFNSDGKYLLSYSPYQKPNPIVCVWKLNVNDGVLGLFGSQSKCIKIISLNPIQTRVSVLSPIHHITNTQILWDTTNKSHIKLQREDKSIIVLDVL